MEWAGACLGEENGVRSAVRDAVLTEHLVRLRLYTTTSTTRHTATAHMLHSLTLCSYVCANIHMTTCHNEGTNNLITHRTATTLIYVYISNG